MKSTNAVAYARVGARDDKSRNKIKRQFSEIEKYAQKNGYMILKKYSDEGFSGNAPDRPALHQLHEDAKLGEWKIVLIYDMSRITRNSKIYQRIKNNLQKNGVKIISLSWPHDLLSLDLISMFDAEHKRSLSKRIKTGIACKKQRK